MFVCRETYAIVLRAIVPLLLVLSACAPKAPAIKSTAPEIPAQFRHAGPWKVAMPNDEVVRGPWWEVFGDATLNRLEQQAAANSPRLEAAAARLRQVIATGDIAIAGSQPQLEAGVDLGRYEASGNRPDQPSKRAGNVAYAGGRIRIPLQASYELDLFGRLGLYREINSERIAAMRASYRSVLLSLQAELAQRYFTLRAADAERRIFRQALELRRKSRNIVQARRENGLASKLDFMRVEAELAATEAEATAQERRRTELEHQIAVLVGELPERFRLDAGELNIEPPVLPVGLPAQLLERRPDIAEAQRQLAARNAEIGLARLAMFPAIRLTAAVGLESFDLASLLQRDSLIWSIGAALLQPLLDGGRTKAGVRRTQAQYEEGFAQYKERLLVAFQEVESALAALTSLSEQRAQQQHAARYAADAEELAHARYQSGVLGLFDFIETQRSRLQAERQLLAVKHLQLLSCVGLIRALGGGWETSVSINSSGREATAR